MSKKILMIVALAAAMTACSKQESAPSAPASSPVPAAAPAPAPSGPEPTAAAPTASADLPKECQDYLDKVSSCVGKQSGAAAEMMQKSMEQTKASWASMGTDKAALGNACKAASDGFAAQASALKC